ncbi:GbsR/MarR family transcriptional regulator [Actinomadura harenae]|uniref:MarR family transcriptional regulator n=1 Tax=Actinomadura harenae TaxID=2483351 RepID=A0A3M2MC82_9ACTN|nr:MarR family transcriptional regulator [Actinomadura harenae]RMI47334.1 MarR family transcriptional regulator [Actinomadura harenae]
MADERAPEGTRDGRDEEAVHRFVERFASSLADSGWPRMAARIFVALLATDSGALTAAELSEELRISPAAVSGAVRYLIHLDLVTREREPGTRRDLYRVGNEAWQEALSRRDTALAKWTAGLLEGSDLLGSATPAGERLAEAAEFFDFIRSDLELILERWEAHRESLRADGQWPPTNGDDRRPDGPRNRAGGRPSR